MPDSLLDRRWPWLLAAAVVVGVFLSTIVEVRAPGDWDRRPEGDAEDIETLRSRDDLNLLFIVIDTLRADHLGAYGYERPTSPAMDRLAATGVRFDRHLAQSSWTKASMASMWTGLYPTRAGITRFDQVIPEQARMPAEILREAGFQTIGLYRNGWLAPTFGFDQGFDVYQRPARLPMPPGLKRENPTLSNAGTDESAVAAALEFLRMRGRERWFLYLHFMDVHEYLYDEESALFGLEYRDVYDNSIRWTDGIVELMLSSLQELGHVDDTLVVITSDHGEAFGEHGLEGHARRVYRETTEIPWLVFFPFRLEEGFVVPNRTRNVDLWPTVLDLMGLEVPQGDGRSFRPELLAAARGAPVGDEQRPAIAHLDQSWARPEKEHLPTVAVSEGPLRYVRIDQENGRVEQLFDASRDPRELKDLAAEDPEAVERLGRVAEQYLEQAPDWGQAPTRDLTELELNHLRALGYALP